MENWLCGGILESHDYMSGFLEKLDEFDLDEYIRTIHFDELKVPSVPFQLPTSRHYYGIEQMKQGELDFFKITVLSKSTEPVFMCSDMPMADMAEDLDFGKKWMFAIAMTLKKGFHNEGKYYLTNNKEEVAYYKKKTARLFSKAQPLMEIYRSDRKNMYNAFLKADAKEEGKRHNMLSSLPIYTMPAEMLADILGRHGVPETDMEQLLEFARVQRELTERILTSSPILDEIVEMAPEEFEKYPMVLSLSRAFYEKEITYTYEEYLEHLRQVLWVL